MSNEHMKRKENQKACSCPLVSQWLHSERLLKPGLLPEQACNDAQRHPWCFEGKDLADLNPLCGMSPNPHGLDVKSIISLCLQPFTCQVKRECETTVSVCN